MLNTVALLIPVFFVAVLIEWYFSYKNQDDKYTVGNFTMNLAIGAIDQICSLFYFAMLYIAMKFVYEHFSFFKMREVWYQWILAYIAIDFLSYWYHRFSHRVNILWAGHVTHHSSEHFNFTNGFRTSFFQGLNRIVFWSFLPLFGFSPFVLVICLKISGIYDFLQHSAYTTKLGFLEKILITPSLHRVHHGKNDIYIDKNYGSTFLIWDQLFGTFQEETETVVYGIKSPYIDNNPFNAITHYYSYLWNMMRALPSWSDKIRILFMPPEWKPHTTAKIENKIQKKHLLISPYLKQYAWFQIICWSIGLIAILTYKVYLSNWEILLYSLIGVTSISNGALIFNDNIGENFIKWEMVRLFFIMLLVLVTLFMIRKIYLLSILFFLGISLIMTGIELTQGHTKVNRSNS
jgi:sterol desaturase/sphingolipid hydroxylase (fatty acid hydroxylase superfamily)